MVEDYQSSFLADYDGGAYDMPASVASSASGSFFDNFSLGSVSSGIGSVFSSLGDAANNLMKNPTVAALANSALTNSQNKNKPVATNTPTMSTSSNMTKYLIFGGIGLVAAFLIYKIVKA
jgi:hypothetical protein